MPLLHHIYHKRNKVSACPGEELTFKPKLSRGSMIRVLIAEDSPNIRDSLSDLLSQEPDMDLVGAAGDGLEAVERSMPCAPT